MKHTPAPPNPSRRQRRGGEALFNKRRAKELAAMAADQERPGVARFRPALRRARHDGWTAERQRAFIEALADTGSVAQAASEAGMSRRSAYTLRRAPSAQAFRFAWDIAMDHAGQVMADNATARAVNGTTVAKLYGGEVVHEEVRFDERLVMRLLASRDPYRFGQRPDLARSEVQREAAAGALQKAVALIETELVASPDGRLSLADASAALEARLRESEREEAAADKTAAAKRERQSLRAAFATFMPPDELDETFPEDPDDDWREHDGGIDNAATACELGELPPTDPPARPSASAPNPAPNPAPAPAVRGPSIRQL